MIPSDLELDLPVGPELPPPPPMERTAFLEYQMSRLADFYASPYYEEWLERTGEEMRNAAPFIME